MITTLVRRVLPLAGLGLVMALLIRVQHVPRPYDDAWFHVRLGREFLSGWNVRSPGHLSAFDSAEWLPTQWLAQEGMAALVDRFGIAGLLWVTGVLTLALTATVYASSRVLASPLPAVLTTVMAMAAASPGLSARPQLFSFLLIAMTTGAWVATARDGRPRYWVVGLAWLWPMLHGMWPVGILISIVSVTGLSMQRGLPTKTLLRMAWIPVLSGVVALLNPLGFGVMETLFVVGSRARFFAEWGPTNFTAPHAAVVAIMLVVVIVAGLRSGPTEWVYVGLTLLALACALYSMRTAPAAALVLAPVFASTLQRLVPDVGRMHLREAAATVALTVVASVAMLGVAVARDSDEVMPRWVAQRLDALPEGSRLLNDWDIGSYLLFRHPELQIVMHGYGDVFTDAELDRNISVVRLDPGWDRQVEDLHVDVALLDTASALAYALMTQAGWTEIQRDEDLVLLTAPTT